MSILASSLVQRGICPNFVQTFGLFRSDSPPCSEVTHALMLQLLYSSIKKEGCDRQCNGKYFVMGEYTRSQFPSRYFSSRSSAPPALLVDLRPWGHSIGSS